MIFVGCFSKICALFATIPDPVIGANFFCMFGMITAVGLSNLQFINLNSSRNLFILGFSLFAGLSLPLWINDDVNKGYVDTGNEEVDQIIGMNDFLPQFVGLFSPKLSMRVPMCPRGSVLPHRLPFKNIQRRLFYSNFRFSQKFALIFNCSRTKFDAVMVNVLVFCLIVFFNSLI